MSRLYLGSQLVFLLVLAPTLVWSQGAYTTNFDLTENPISEGGRWVNGGVAGGSDLWGNVQTAGGMAFGVSEPTKYGDPTAILGGTWGSNQTVTVTVRINTAQSVCCHEVELRLLTSISSGRIAGYEINCSVSSSNRYMQLVRWNGPNGDFTQLDQLVPATQCQTGDVLQGTAAVAGKTVTFTLRRNGVLQTFTTCHCTNPSDSSGQALLTGNPGIGFYDDADTNWNYFGLDSFSATDGQGPAPPTSLTATPH